MFFSSHVDRSSFGTNRKPPRATRESRKSFHLGEKWRLTERIARGEAHYHRATVVQEEMLWTLPFSPLLEGKTTQFGEKFRRAWTDVGRIIPAAFLANLFSLGRVFIVISRDKGSERTSQGKPMLQLSPQNKNR